MDAHARRRPLVRPRHRRQQGPAHDQLRGARARDRRARPPRLQRQGAARDRRGDGLARIARRLRRGARGARRRRADRLRRAAPARRASRRCSWARAARSTSTSPSTCATAATTPATGAGSSPIPGPFSRTRSRRWSTRAGGFSSKALRPPPIPASVRAALATIEPGEPGGPAIDTGWGEPGLTPAERVFAWNALEVLAFVTGNPANPVNAIPPRASAHMQLRFVVGCDPDTLRAGDTRASRRARLSQASTSTAREAAVMHATRLDPAHPVGHAASRSRSRPRPGRAPAILPNLGGSLPNDCFADVLGLPTVWVPHSYPACSQHAPNEHLLGSVAREGLAIMTGIFWDLGRRAAPAQFAARCARSGVREIG